MVNKNLRSMTMKTKIFTYKLINSIKIDFVLMQQRNLSSIIVI